MRTENTSKTSTVVVNTQKEEKKRVNPTWEAMLKYQPAFTYVAPEMSD